MLVENLANAETTRTPEGGPYRRKDVVFESASVESPFSSVFDAQMHAAGGVGVSEVVTDMRDPGAPLLAGPSRRRQRTAMWPIPRVNPAEDMVDLMGATRSYQANVAAIGAVKDMIQRSIDLFR